MQSMEALMRSNKFLIDYNSQLYDFAGFRVTTGRKGVADGVSYVNVYTTDKTSMYQLHWGTYCRRSPKDTLAEKDLDSILQTVNNLLGLYDKCADIARGMGDGQELGGNMEGCTRFKVRVKGGSINTALASLSASFLNMTTFAIPLEVWWCVEQQTSIEKLLTAV